ncbi:peptidase T [Arcicella rosea]|uniref:Peptidase T n=1 Tax=Arcicella rosea TaxID=502909 RepID=A0A841ESD0_9BACT|nr:peptidase T [Arcicella rosea]MBB6004309.1 tripeptide aminopeptidase [Arcicella rosea]
MLKNYKNTSTERFLKYVQIDTQSDSNSTSQPSTLKQKDLSKLLVQELIEMGIQDAHLDEFGYVYATIPSNTEKPVPVICFCSHVDTSPDCSGEGVKPIIHQNYQGKDIVLPDDNSQIIRLADHPDLAHQLGNDIITASGTTLLGADNKAGVAEIIDAAYHLVNNPEINHGTVKILFTPDEEIGRGTVAVDLEKLGADFGYTIDGETLGSLEDETFSADGVKISIQGVSQHPGFAKGKMESALKIAAEIVANLPKETLSPETTEGKEGFIHPVGISGMVENATVEFIVRDFSVEKLHEHEAVLKEIMDKILINYPNSIAIFEVFEQYRNMKEVLDKTPQVTAYAFEAIERSGIKAKQMSIRGGTDGSRLSFMGLPCPNIFAGEHAFHGKHEWVSVQDMEKATETIIHLCEIWEEKTQ